MKLIFTPPGLKAGAVFSPEEADQRHLIKVLRVREGDTVEGSDGRSRLTCRVAMAGKNLKLKVAAVEALVDLRSISLAVARIETDRFSSAVSAAAQMAVREIFAVECERADRKPLALDRLKRVAREAAKQVGCPFLPDIRELRSVHELAAVAKGKTAFLLDPLAPQTLIECLPMDIDPGTGLLLIVGPVGDFTAQEKQTLQAAGARPAQLCGEILRSETAAVVALGVAATYLRSSARKF
ncbi:RsmE family RNA methyltransferase [bacterium]|nr:RsmE family RNA methyltransferase [bacterium]